MLSNRQQVARLRHLAVQALGAYPLAAPEVRFIAHGENTTFRVDAMTAGGRDRFLLCWECSRCTGAIRSPQRPCSPRACAGTMRWVTAGAAPARWRAGPRPQATSGPRVRLPAAAAAVPGRIEATLAGLNAAADELIAARRDQPGPDLLSGLIADEADGDRLAAPGTFCMCTVGERRDLSGSAS